MNSQYNGLSKRTWIIVISILALFIILNIVNKCNNARYNRVSRIPISVSNYNWNKLLFILDKIDKNYVDTLDYKKLSDDVITKLLQSLDPHSIYLPPQDMAQAEESLSGNFSGIGVEFNIPNDTAVIVNVIPGGPSERVGIQSGDRIVKVNETNIAGVKFEQDSIIKLLRGPRGSTVDVQIKRAGLEKLVPFTIKRDIIAMNSLDAAVMIDDKMGYIKLSKFSLTTYNEFLKAANKLKKEGMTTLLLDLRDNPGGYMDQAFYLASEFLAKDDLVVYMEGEHRPREEMRVATDGKYKDIKLYVAINESSASSSEIVAGAIQDNDRGIIVGRRSFGKGLVQEQMLFSDASGIRLTVARFYTPSGRCIQKPYSTDYRFDILERFSHGELLNEDSIRKNNTLEYKTLKEGRTVYGGGGIIPDIFVPIDTVGVTPFLIAVNKNSLQMKFSSAFADSHRERLTKIKTFKELERLFSTVNIGKEFLNFSAKSNIIPAKGEWEISGNIIEQQLKGLIGRYSGMDDDAYYSYILKIDNLVDKIKENENNK